jgi:uncharacterized protein (DUF1778 family)
MARTENLDIRVSPDEKAAIQAAAERDSRTVSDWARLALLRAAKKETPRWHCSWMPIVRMGWPSN